MTKSLDEKFQYSLDVIGYNHFPSDTLNYREVKTLGTILWIIKWSNGVNEIDCFEIAKNNKSDKQIINHSTDCNLNSEKKQALRISFASIQKRNDNLLETKSWYNEAQIQNQDDSKVVNLTVRELKIISKKLACYMLNRKNISTISDTSTKT
jgi:hypothetical protein